MHVDQTTLTEDADTQPKAMPLYRGTKEVRARPMTRGEYNAYRGWAPPAGEDQDVGGYLVEYTDGLGQPSDPRHAGYISWSPHDVFEAAYRPCEGYLDRVKLELDELQDRTAALFESFDSPAFNALDPVRRDLLTAQFAAMQAYERILLTRVNFGVSNNG